MAEHIGRDTCGLLMQYEEGRMNPDEQVEFFQRLIDTGLAWTLQGHYGRTAMALVQDGQCVLPDVERTS